MSIWFVRHGETDGNVQHILQRPDIPLNERGLWQARQVAVRLSALSAAQIVSSDLTRAQMTADAIARATGTRPAVELTPLLAERNFGDLRGTPYSAIGADPFAPDFVPPNGESWDAFHARIAEAFAMIVRQKQRVPGAMIVVTHGLVCRALAQRHLTLPTGQGAPDRFGNTSVTEVEAIEPYRVRLLNSTTHLNDADVADGGAAQ